MRRKRFMIPAMIAGTLFGLAGYLALVGSLEAHRVTQTQTPRPASESAAQETAEKVSSDSETNDWLTYQWSTITFKYPPDWEVRKEYYLTPPQEAAGEPPHEIGLTVWPKAGQVEDGHISFGGRQVACGSPPFIGLRRCFSIGYPIYTISQNPEIVRVYDLLLKTVTYNDPAWGFQILSPAFRDKLNTNGTCTIRWRTKPGRAIQTVSIEVFEASMYWKEGTVLFVDNVPNTGSYEWTVPSTVPSPGPYLLRIWFVEPTVPPLPGTLGASARYEGTSNPFYISAP